MRLRDWRIERKLTQDQLGAQIGVTGVTVSRYETGDRIPEPDVMFQIKEITNGAVLPNDFYRFAEAVESEARVSV